jgi:anti-sigma factor RsiW
VERHLIGCPACRAEQASLTTAVAVLHEAAVEAPIGSAAPEIWPALDRQIRASRHARPGPWAGLGLGPSLGLAAGLLIAGTAIGLMSSRLPAPSAPRPDPGDHAATTPAPRPALPEGPAGTQLAGAAKAAPKPEARVDLEPKPVRDPQPAVGQ